MIRTRYPRLKLILVPVNAMAAAVASGEFFPQAVRAVCGVIAAGGVALYALINEVPRDHDGEDAGVSK